MAGEVRIKIIGSDMATPTIRGVTLALQQMGHAGREAGNTFPFLKNMVSSAMGFIARDVINQGVQSLRMLSSEALDAVMNFERMSIMLEGMVARDIKRASDGALSYADALAQAGEKTQELIQWIEQVAIRSPYATSAVQDAFADLAKYGFPIEKAKEMTQAMLDMAAGSGLTQAQLGGVSYALGQIYASDKLLIQDLRQLMNAGIDVRSILERMGLTFEELKEKTKEGGVATKDFLEAFIQIAKEDYAGSLDRMTNSWAGMVGALQDVKEIGLRKLFQGVFEVLQPLVQKFTDWLLGPGLDRLEAIGESLGNLVFKVVSLVSAFDEAGLFSIEFREALSLFGDKAVETYDRIAPVLEKIWEKFIEVGGKIKESVRTLFSEGLFSEEFRQSLYNIDPVVGQVYDTIMTKLRPAWEWIVDHKDGLIEAAKAIGVVLLALRGFQIVSGIITMVATTLGFLLTPLGLLISLVGFLAMAWYYNWGGIREQMTATYYESILPTFEYIKQTLGEIATDLGLNQIAWLSWANTGKSAGDYFAFTMQYTRHAIGMIMALIRGDLKAFVDHWKELSISIGEFLDPMLENIVGRSLDIRREVEALDVYLWQAFEIMKIKVLSTMDGFYAGIENTFIRIWNSIATFVNRLSGLAGQISQKIAQAFNPAQFSNIGKSIIDGIVKGVLDNAYRIALAFNGAIIPVIQAIKAILGISSPSKVFAEIGQQMAAGMALGYRQGLEQVVQPTSALPALSTGGVGAVNVMVNVNAQVSNDVDVRELAIRIADEIRLRSFQARGAML